MIQSSFCEAESDEGQRLPSSPNSRFTLTPNTELGGGQVLKYEESKIFVRGIEYLDIFERVTMDCRSTEDNEFCLGDRLPRQSWELLCTPVEKIEAS